jgi:DNA-binding transcriptional MerR regulator
VRVAELAELTGTTPRTVRHYHQIGLLPVPEVVHGRREYTLAHVARMTRIRWLARAGVPLAGIAGLVGTSATRDAVAEGDQRAGVLADLHDVLGAIDAEVERLTGQRKRLSDLVASVESGAALSPAPPAVVRFYDEAERRAEDESVRRLIREERDFTELAFYRGDMPREIELLFAGFDDAAFANSLADYQFLAEQGQPAGSLTDDQVRSITADAIERFRRRLGPDLPRLARALDVDVARRAADLYVRLAPAPGRLEQAMADAVLDLIEEGRRS